MQNPCQSARPSATLAYFLANKAFTAIAKEGFAGRYPANPYGFVTLAVPFWQGRAGGHGGSCPLPCRFPQSSAPVGCRSGGTLSEAE